MKPFNVIQSIYLLIGILAANNSFAAGPGDWTTVSPAATCRIEEPYDMDSGPTSIIRRFSNGSIGINQSGYRIACPITLRDGSSRIREVRISASKPAGVVQQIFCRLILENHRGSSGIAYNEGLIDDEWHRDAQAQHFFVLGGRDDHDETDSVALRCGFGGPAGWRYLHKIQYR